PAAKGRGATFYGSTLSVQPEKAALVCASADREWDSNGTVFGWNPELGNKAGEFGHNDYYGAVVAACQDLQLDGRTALIAMLLHDEIRGRLAECFSLKDCFIDHVLHGAIATAAVVGAIYKLSVDQIEQAIGMTVAHYVPFRAIRAGHQLSDSKGASAAFSTEVAFLAVKRAALGFIGPQDIFRNPQAPFRLFCGPEQKFQRVGAKGEPNSRSADESPFDLTLTRAGSDFAVMGMHFKLGLYEHQSAGAIQACIDLLASHPELLLDSGNPIGKIIITAYQPAFGIIGDPAKRDPHTRQSADHSMVYIVGTLIRKATEIQRSSWKDLILLPPDYDDLALHHPLTRKLMARIEFRHGGDEYDRRYPDGIPTSVLIQDGSGASFDSSLVMYPAGHARNHLTSDPCDLENLLDNKWGQLCRLAKVAPSDAISGYGGIGSMTAEELRAIHQV
ncbi:MAG: hypothetical protein DCC75_09480, partial [Proteobacteria bacterium]